MCITAQAADPTKPGVWWRDDADWKLYDVLQSAAILTAIAGGVSKVDLPGVASLKYKGGATYKVDLYNMKQINVASGYTRDVKVVLKAAPGTPVTDDNASVKEELQACKEVTKILHFFQYFSQKELASPLHQLSRNSGPSGQPRKVIFHVLRALWFNVVCRVSRA